MMSNDSVGLIFVLFYQRDADCFPWTTSLQSWSQVCRACFAVVGKSHRGRKARDTRGQSTTTGWRQSAFWRGILFCRACRSCKRSRRDEYRWCLRRELRPQKHARSLEHSTAAFTFERRLLVSFFSSPLNAEHKAAPYGVGRRDFATIQKYGHYVSSIIEINTRLLINTARRPIFLSSYAVTDLKLVEGLCQSIYFPITSITIGQITSMHGIFFCLLKEYEAMKDPLCQQFDFSAHLAQCEENLIMGIETYEILAVPSFDNILGLAMGVSRSNLIVYYNGIWPKLPPHRPSKRKARPSLFCTPVSSLRLLSIVKRLGTTAIWHIRSCRMTRPKTFVDYSGQCMSLIKTHLFCWGRLHNFKIVRSTHDILHFPLTSPFDLGTNLSS